ncbi:hypothetical protein SRHO_G00034930 [Serrasalmus rhombeus]
MVLIFEGRSFGFSSTLAYHGRLLTSCLYANEAQTEQHFFSGLTTPEKYRFPSDLLAGSVLQCSGSSSVLGLAAFADPRAEDRS